MLHIAESTPNAIGLSNQTSFGCSHQPSPLLSFPFSSAERKMGGARNDQQSVLHALSRKAKRVLDIVIGLGCLIVLSPLLMLIAVAVRWDSPGSIFYISDRAGLRGQSFRCVKFRTMNQGAHAMRSNLEHLNEREGVLFKIAKDPRITRLGAVLRKYSLDELPQLWNVLRGEMSLVGPRPPLHEEVAQYTSEQMERLDVEPGITGLWQVEARSDPSFDRYIRLDRAYVHSWSFWLDLKILARTFHVVVKGTGT